MVDRFLKSFEAWEPRTRDACKLPGRYIEILQVTNELFIDVICILRCIQILAVFYFTGQGQMFPLSFVIQFPINKIGGIHSIFHSIVQDD